jgi:malyl-CoA/(S)-citramalyl-CoA lyase
LNDIWQVALFHIVVAAKANGLRAIDCPYGDFNDNEGFKALAKSSYSLGFDGKMLIHPKQIELSNKIFSPTKKELNDAKEMLKVIKKSSNSGKGAIAFNGKLLDIVTIKQAKNIVDLNNKILLKKND